MLHQEFSCCFTLSFFRLGPEEDDFEENLLRGNLLNNAQTNNAIEEQDGGLHSVKIIPLGGLKIEPLQDDFKITPRGVIR
jgi:hypothetical protein